MSTHTIDINAYPETDEDAEVMALMINGRKPDPYYGSPRQPSDEDEIVYENYEKAINVVENPNNYDEDEVEEIIGVILYDYKDRFSSYDGNYNADISDNEFVKKFHQSYIRKMAYYKGCITKINNKEYENETDKAKDLSKARKYKPNDLGKEMKRLINELEKILEDKQMVISEPDSE
tara:strand:+ start:793 stop:1323 length:531 start_codon:yes stop_codon:yes gene_type:complete